MTRITKAELASDLTDLFQLLEPGLLSPEEFSRVVVPTFPLLPGTHKFRTASNETNTGAANAITVARAPVPDGFYDYVISAALSSTADAVAHNASIAVDGIAGVLANTKGVTRVLTAGTSALYVERSFLIPPGKVLRGDIAEPGTLGFNLVLFLEFVRHRILEQHPQV